MGLDLLIFDDSVEKEHRKAEHSENTGISFSIDEWGDFFDELDIPTLGPYVEGEDRVERDRKEKALFKAALSDFPMLSRIDEYYADAEYDSQQVRQLLTECSSILPKLTNTHSL